MVPVVGKQGQGGFVSFYLLLLSYIILLVVMWYNHQTPFFSLICLGLFLNFLVIAVNGGMPVSLKSMSIASFQKEISDFKGFNDFIHIVMDEGTKLKFLGDIIPIPGPTFLRQVISFGDILLSIGVFLFIQKGMVYQGKRVKSKSNGPVTQE